MLNNKKNYIFQINQNFRKQKIKLAEGIQSRRWKKEINYATSLSIHKLCNI